MKFWPAILAAIMAAPAVAPVQKTQQLNPPAGEVVVYKSLASVTWNVEHRRLVWVVRREERDGNGKLETLAIERYEIDPDAAVMEFGGEKRGFAKEEARELSRLLDNIFAPYCVQSVMWWDEGKGVKLDKDGKPIGPPPAPPQKHNPSLTAPAGRIGIAMLKGGERL